MAGGNKQTLDKLCCVAPKWESIVEVVSKTLLLAPMRHDFLFLALDDGVGRVLAASAANVICE